MVIELSPYDCCGGHVKSIFFLVTDSLLFDAGNFTASVFVFHLHFPLAVCTQMETWLCHSMMQIHNHSSSSGSNSTVLQLQVEDSVDVHRLNDSCINSLLLIHLVSLG